MKEYSLLIVGIGGQGVLTLSNIIAEAALLEGYDVKTSELHGLSQRYGHIPCHVRFGDKIYSPLIRKGRADLIIALEPLEALRACCYGSKKNRTVFLVNTYKILPISVSIMKEEYPSMKYIVKTLRKFSKNVFTINASKKVMKETGNIVATNVYMLGHANANKLIPLKEKSLVEGMRKVIREKYFDMNKRVFELAC